MKLKIYNPDGVAPPLGLYKHVARANATASVFVAGQVGVDEGGTLVGKDDLPAQMRQVFHNLQRALASAGAGFRDVAKFTTYLTRRQDLEAFMATRKALFAEYFPDGDYPPNTLLFVSGLVHPDMLIEVEAIAAVDA